MGILSGLKSIWDWICGAVSSGAEWIGDLVSDNAGKVRRAVSSVSSRIFGSSAARDWLCRSSWNACADPVAAMRNPAERDAAVYETIQTFYQNSDDPARMMQSLTQKGFNNGTTTRAYVINSGEDSIGRGDSRHQAVLITDETRDPPQLTLAFRGMNPLTEGLGVSMGMLRVATGSASGTINGDAEKFWRDAGPEIRRILSELQARHPGKPVEITLAGHSYGADGAARMIPRLAEIVPPESIRYVGYGGVQSMTREDRDRIWDVLGGERAGRATQYMARNDWVRLVGWGYTLGTRRDIPTDTGHLNYAATGNVTSLMAAVEDQVRRTPERAREVANRIIADFDRDSAGTLASLANYARDMAGSSGTPQGTTSRNLQPQPSV